jgi:hypothetical protein
MFSCGKADNSKEKIVINDVAESEDTAAMTPSESFSSALTDAFLDESGDEGLQYYLEEEIFPIISKADKVTIDKISASIYLLSYNEGNEMKNFIIRKIYNPQLDEISFQREDVQFEPNKYFIK